MKKTLPEIKFLLESLAFQDSEPALKSLYFTYCDRIMRYLFMYVKSEEVAEELVLDVFFVVWENRKILPEINNFESYIYKLAKFKALNYLRDQRMINVDLDRISIDLFTHTETNPEDDYISKELIEIINDAIEQLPPKCKIAFKLVREDGMKYKDAADHLGISVKTLETHLSSAMKKIKSIILHSIKGIIIFLLLI